MPQDSQDRLEVLKNELGQLRELRVLLEEFLPGLSDAEQDQAQPCLDLVEEKLEQTREKYNKLKPLNYA